MLNVSKLIKRIRGLTNQRTDDSLSSYFTDDEIKDFMQANFGALYKQMVETSEGYFIKELPFSITDSNTKSFDLPNDFYRVCYIERLSGGFNNPVRIDEISLAEKDQYFENYRNWYNQSRKIKFYFQGNKIYFVPDESLIGDYKFFYVPDTPEIDSPDLKIPKDFDQYLVFSTALNIALPEEGDNLKFLSLEYQKWAKYVASWMKDRTNKSPRQIQQKIDLYGRDKVNEKYWEYNDEFF